MVLGAKHRESVGPGARLSAADYAACGQFDRPSRGARLAAVHRQTTPRARRARPQYAPLPLPRLQVSKINNVYATVMIPLIVQPLLTSRTHFKWI